MFNEHKLEPQVFPKSHHIYPKTSLLLIAYLSKECLMKDKVMTVLTDKGIYWTAHLSSC